MIILSLHKGLYILWGTIVTYIHSRNYYITSYLNILPVITGVRSKCLMLGVCQISFPYKSEFVLVFKWTVHLLILCKLESLIQITYFSGYLFQRLDSTWVTSRLRWKSFTVHCFIYCSTENNVDNRKISTCWLYSWF